ncbi:MAG: MlaD family protein [Cyanobacteria bacterium P01_A01_bin.105]
MRSRTIREGSVGLLILTGIGLFGFLVLWLRGINPGQRSYYLQVNFANTSGLQTGTPVSYRGVPVGRIVEISTGTNTVDVRVEILDGALRIPAAVSIETTQAGLIGETAVSMTPLATLTESQLAISPVASDCDSQVILCDGDRLDGSVGVSYEDLLRSSQQISEFLTNPAVTDEIDEILANTNDIAENVVDLTAELTLLAEETRTQLEPLALSAQQSLDSVGSAAQQIEISTARTAQSLDVTLIEVNNLLAANRGNLSTTLDNITASSVQLRNTLDVLGPRVREGRLLDDLEQLTANATVASADLRDITRSLNTPENLVLLQQTLESARDVFQGAQKIMADIDELTGDPAFRLNIRDLVNGLSGLVSSTQQLETQTQLAHLLENASSVAAAESVPDATPDRPQLSQGEPVLIFDGQRYTVRLANQPDEAPASEPASAGEPLPQSH